MISHNAGAESKVSRDTPRRGERDNTEERNARNPSENWNVSSLIFHLNDSEKTKKIGIWIQNCFSDARVRSTLSWQIINGCLGFDSQKSPWISIHFDVRRPTRSVAEAFASYQQLLGGTFLSFRNFMALLIRFSLFLTVVNAFISDFISALPLPIRSVDEFLLEIAGSNLCFVIGNPESGKL